MSQHKDFWEGSTDSRDYTVAYYKSKVGGGLLPFGKKDNRVQNGGGNLQMFAQQKFEESVANMQHKLTMPLDSSIIMIENYNDLRMPMFYNILGSNLGCIFSCLHYSDAPYYYHYYTDGYNVKAESVFNNGSRTHLYCFRKLKRGMDRFQFTNIVAKNGGRLTMKEVNEYTESILPFVKQKLNLDS